MAKETSSANPSLPLHEVLEAEFTALHDELPADYPNSTESEGRLKAFCAAVHGLKEKHAALCISGGGIRSATFGLGVLQGLARCGLLNKFHYLSTVSGGGYIGSWLSAWIKNHPQGVDGVVAELKRRPDSILDPEPRPIRHLREFSNYLSPRLGLTSMDSWTLIATFMRNIFLNWLVLISWLAAAMMIPRLYLAVVLYVQPNWGTDPNLVPQITHSWDRGLAVLLMIGFALIAIAMAYAIIDVPSTGNARLSQRRFLKFRQLPLFLASLILAAWWAVYWNIHYGDPFPAKDWLLKFVLCFISTYICGGLLGPVVLSFRKREQKARTGRVWRIFVIVLTAAFAGFCLWAMATRMFVAPSKIEFTLKRDCEAIEIRSGQKTTIPKSIKATTIQGRYTIETDQGPARIAKKDLDALEPMPVPLPVRHALNYVCFAPALILAVLLLVNFLFTGLTSWVTEDEDREWWGRSAAWILVTIIGWIVVNAIVLWGAQAITATTKGSQLDVFLGYVEPSSKAQAILGAFGGMTGIAGALMALRSKLSNKLGMKLGSQWPLIVVAVVFFVLLAIVISWILLLIGWQPWVHQLAVFLGQLMMNPKRKIILLGAFGGVTGITGVLLVLRSGLSKKLVFFVLLAVVIWWILLLFGSKHLVQTPDDGQAQLFVVFLLTSITLVVGIAMGFFINANKFSLHATYRNRLIRAYLAASRPAREREPSLFTGFDPADNFALCELSPGRPLHVLNGALNLVKGEELAWQERKAESFTMSRLHCGCWDPRVGYRPSDQYGRGNTPRGITLGTAMAISGAAANPNMGYHSSPIVGFLMTLFNVRLGWWLGNPGPSGAKTWRRAGPGYSVGPLFSEAVGNTTDHYKYVNLSDGGHFENLGLYEMVLRRCHYIVVSDGGQDPECSFADLGEAVRKIRIDFGIPIEFGPMSIYPRSAIDTLKTPGHSCAIGRIRYSVVDGDAAPDGVIVYIKPACYGDEPRDIYEYFKTNPAFPHESTADQFFSESQFESYRMLGAHTMERLCTDCGGDFRCFIRSILKRHLTMKAPDWLSALLGTKREWLTRLKFSCRKLQK